MNINSFSYNVCKIPFYDWRSVFIFEGHRQGFIWSASEEQGLRILLQMGHSQQTLNQVSPLFRRCYFCFHYLPNAEISTISLIQNMPDAIDEAFCRQVASRTLLILGNSDNFLSVPNASTFFNQFADGHMKVFKGAGHLP